LAAVNENSGDLRIACFRRATGSSWGRGAHCHSTTLHRCSRGWPTVGRSHYLP